MSQKRQRIGPVLAAAILGALAVGTAFYFKPYPALEDAGLLRTDASVRVERGAAGIAFLPAAAAWKTSGLAFYGGSRVPPEAYAYLGRACARAGYVAVLAAPPLNFAPLAPGLALRAAAAYPGVARWVLAGHGLGGSAAAAFAAGERGERMAVAGLLLLAAAPGRAADLSTKTLPVVMVSASRDALVGPAAIAAAGDRLPKGSRFVEISGGNHAQFGEYGPQPGDGLAEVSGSTQREAAVEEALALLDRVEPGAAK